MSRRSRHFNDIQRWVPPQRAKKREAGGRDFRLAVIRYLVNFFQKEYMEMTVSPGLFNIAAIREIPPLLYRGLLVQAIRAFHAKFTR